MNRNLSSKIGYRLKSNPLQYFGDQILAEIQGFEGHASPKPSKEMTMQPTATAKPATAAPATPSTPKPGAFGALMSRIQTCLTSITPSAEQLPSVPAVIAEGRSRDSYPASLVAMLPPIPESLLPALTTDIQSLQSDARANTTIPRIFTLYHGILVAQDEVNLAGEQAHLRALLSAFNWYMDGWTDASRTELR